MPTDICYVFRRACEKGRLDVVKWMTEEFEFDLSSEDFGIACLNYHFEVAKWLVEKFGITAEYVRSENNLIFRQVCERGRLEAAKWLTNTFSLTIEDARSMGNWA